MRAATIRVIMVIGGLAAWLLVPLASAAAGTAAYYTPPYVPSACYGFQDNGVMIAAASDAIWNNGTACGRNYRVTYAGTGTNACSGGSVVVKIVDYCPPVCAATIVLSQEAFAMICNPSVGKIAIEFA